MKYQDRPKDDIQIPYQTMVSHPKRKNNYNKSEKISKQSDFKVSKRLKKHLQRHPNV